MGVGKNNPFAGNGLGNIAFSPDGTGSTNSSGSGESQQTGALLTPPLENLRAPPYSWRRGFFGGDSPEKCSPPASGGMLED